DELAPPPSREVSQQVSGAQLKVVTARDVYLACESSGHADFIATPCVGEKPREECFAAAAHTAEPTEKPQSACHPLVGQQCLCQSGTGRHGPDSTAKKLPHHCRQLPKCLQCNDFQLSPIILEVVADIDRHSQRE